MRAPIISLLTLGAWLVAASCALPVRGGGYMEEGAEVDRYRTFAWNEEGDSESGTPRLDEDPSFEPLLHAAVEEKLAERGIRPTESSPDLRVHHHLSVTQHSMVTEAVRESGYTEPEIREYDEGTVLVHLVDAETGENVWLGWAQADVGSALAGEEGMEEWVDGVVSTMFEAWPASSPGDGR